MIFVDGEMTWPGTRRGLLQGNTPDVTLETWGRVWNPYLFSLSNQTQHQALHLVNLTVQGRNANYEVHSLCIFLFPTCLIEINIYYDKYEKRNVEIV